MCRKGLGDRQIDLVLSDMAPSNPGFASVNHDMTLRLVNSVLEVISISFTLFVDLVSLPVLRAHSCARFRPPCEDFCRVWPQQDDRGSWKVDRIKLLIFYSVFFPSLGSTPQ